jgi:hypothetical protein
MSSAWPASAVLGEAINPLFDGTRCKGIYISFHKMGGDKPINNMDAMCVCIYIYVCIICSYVYIRILYIYVYIHRHKESASAVSFQLFQLPLIPRVPEP